MTSACGSLQSANIGSVTGSATYDACDSDTIFISANDVPSSTADKQYSVQREVCGDGEVIVNVLSVSGGLAGLELRASNAPGAIKVGLRTALGTSVQRFVRTSTDGAQSSNNTTALGHKWLKLVRSGSSVSTYTSTNGSTWNFAATYTVSLPTCVQASLLVQSVNVNTTHTGVFKDLQFSSFTDPEGDPTTVSFDQDTISAEAGDTISICLSITNPCICSPTGVDVQLAGSNTPHFVGYQPENLTFEAEDTTLCFLLPVSNVQVNGYYKFVIDPYTDDTLTVLIAGAGGDPGPVGVCGVEPAVYSIPDSLSGASIFDMPVKAMDRFGNYYPAEKLGPSSSCGCEDGSGIFELTFQDVCLNRNYGFDDPTDGPARQEVVCRMFRDLSALLNPGNAIADDLVNIEIRASNGNGINLMEDYQIGVASPIYYGGGFEDGIIAGLVEKAIQSRTDPNLGLAPFGFSSNSFHGFVRFNFEDFDFYLNNTDWVSNPTGDKDLYSVALHEALHLLGFASLIDAQDANRYSKLTEFGSPRCYSKYDTYLRTLNGLNTTSNGTKYYLKYPLMGDPYGIDVATTPSFFGTLCTADVEMHGPSCNNQSLYRPDPWSEQGVTHFNCDASGEGGCATQNGYVMNACAADGEAQRHPHQQEVNMLCDLGYELSYEYGTLVYVGPDNLLPFKWDYTTCSPGCNAIGVNDLLLFEYIESGGTLDIETEAFTGNDINTVDYIPNSFEILNVNYDVGTVVDNGNGFTFHASDVYSGPVIIRYLPKCSDGSPGQWAFIILRVTAAALSCTDDNSCELVCYGDFENLPPGGASALQDFRISSNSGMTTDIITASTTSPIITGAAVCNTEHPNGASFPVPHTDITPNTTFAGFETQFDGLNQEGLQFKLKEPLEITTYELSFYVYSGCPNTLNFHFTHEPACPASENNSVGSVLFNGAPQVACDNYTYVAGQFQSVLFDDTDTDDDNIPEWVKYTTTFTADDTYSYLTVYQTRGPKYAYFDNISVKRLEPREVTVSFETLGSFCPGESSEVLYTICSEDPLEDIELLATLGVPPLAFFEESGDFVNGETTISELFPSGGQYCAQVTLNLLLAEGLAEGTEIPVHLSLLNTCTNSNIEDAVIVIAYQPDASFTYSETNCVFDFTSSDPALGFDHQWTFESTETTIIIDDVMNPEDLMFPDGEYLVTHTVSNECGIDIETETITVEGCCELPFPDAEYDFEAINACGDYRFWVIDPSEEITAITWNFGEDVEHGEEVEYTFTEPGEHTLTLTLTNSCGLTTTYEETIEVELDLPDASFTPTIFCLNTFFEAVQTEGDHFWDFDDGGTDDTDNPTPQHTFAAAGTYTVVHTFTNACGFEDTEEVIITVIDCGVEEFTCPCNTLYNIDATTQPNAEVLLSDLINTGTLPAAFLANTCLALKGRLIVDVDYSLVYIEGRMHSGAEMVVQPTATLALNSVSQNGGLHGCEEMWRGIRVFGSGGGLFRSKGSIISDAQFAVHALDKSTIDIQGTNFTRNYVGLFFELAPGIGGTFDLLPFHSNIFDGEEDLLPPYDGQAPEVGDRPFAGISLTNCSAPIHIGVTAAGVNTFRDIHNGILTLNTPLSVERSVFENVVEVADEPEYDFTGFGIRHEGGAAHSFTQTGLGNESTDDPSFSNCTNAIWGIGTNADITANNMENVVTGVRLEFGTQRTLAVADNLINAILAGVDLFQNAPATSISVRDNVINMNEGNGALGAGTAIRVEENTLPHPASSAVIDDNRIIAYGWFDQGIRLSSAAAWNVTNNKVKLEGVLPSAIGINVLKGSDNEVRGNQVEGESSGFGINVNASGNTFLECNTVTANYAGLNLVGENSGADVATTLFRIPMVYGLRYTNGIMAPIQNGRGNRWEGGAEDYEEVAAVHEGDDEFAIQSTAHRVLEPYDDIEQYNYYPPSIALPNIPLLPTEEWFQEGVVTSIICTSQPQFTDGEDQLNLARQLAKDSMDHFPAGTVWDAKWGLYEKLLKNPGLMSEDSILSDFFDETALTTLGALVEIEQAKAALFAPTSETEFIAVFTQDLDSLIHLIQEVDSLIVADSLTTIPSERQEWVEAAQTLVDSIQELNIIVDSLHLLEITALSEDNDEITPTKRPEKNQKTVNKLYLDVLAKGSLGFTQSQKDTISAIAAQCPQIGGRAVFIARAMRAYLSDVTYVETEPCVDSVSMLVAPHIGRVLPQESLTQQQEKYGVKIFPNPAEDYVKVTHSFDKPTQLILYDAYGRIQKAASISGARQQHQISTTNLAPGVYIASIVAENAKAVNLRLIIVR